MDDSTLCDLATNCTSVQELSLVGCCLVTNRGLRHIAQVPLRAQAVCFSVAVSPHPALCRVAHSCSLWCSTAACKWQTSPAFLNAAAS